MVLYKITGGHRGQTFYRGAWPPAPLKTATADKTCRLRRSEQSCCLNLVSNLQPGLICKRVHEADRTGQNCSVFNISKTIENSLDLSPILLTPPIRQDNTMLSSPSRWSELGIKPQHKAHDILSTHRRNKARKRGLYKQQGTSLFLPCYHVHIANHCL